MRSALVIEGGGMRAAFANGVLSAFEEAGHFPWHTLYGTSAGGALAAWYAAGQARFAEATWEYATDRRILNYRRWITRRGPVLDHDFLLDEVYRVERPLDVGKVQACPVPVIVTASDVDSGACHYQDLRHGNVILWLKATGRLPFASGPAVEILGRRYLDGGITDPIPIRKAVADGHRRIVFVSNQVAAPYRRDAAVVTVLTARRFPALSDGILRHAEIKEAALRYAESPPAGIRIDIIRPLAATGVHRLSRNADTIRATIEAGRTAGHAWLDAEEDRLAQESQTAPAGRAGTGAEKPSGGRRRKGRDGDGGTRV